MTTVAIAALLGAPLAAGLLSLLLTRPKVLHALNFASMVTVLLAETALTRRVLADGPVVGLSELVYVDALSAFVLMIIGLIGLGCSLYTWSYLDAHVASGALSAARLKHYFFLFHMFVFAMIAATVANSLGVLWVAIEGTTFATTLLIAFFRNRGGLEAGWKYLLLCSVGIALALFGTVLTYYSSVHVLGDVSEALNITKLLETADRLDASVLRLAFLFVLVGYGTKIGLVPMHTWLPEAYSEAPAPVTAMLAGVLETVAVYAVLRVKIIVDHVLPAPFTGNLLILFGLASVVLAALFVLIQHNYKRLFAYSSIEHMGLAVAGFGVGGPIGTFGALFHLLNHALAKALAFFAAGNVHRRFGTREIGDVRGLVRVQPVTAAAFLIAVLALIGLPPFSLFSSQLMVATALGTQLFASDTFHLGQFVTVTLDDNVRSLLIAGVVLLSGVLVFGGFIAKIVTMLWGTPPETVRQGEAWEWGHVPLMAAVAALVLLGVFLPDMVRGLLLAASDVLLIR
jgi:hydrogenase-4 component F